MKKILAMLLVLVMVLSLAACGEKTPVETQKPADNTPTTGNNETPTEEVGQVYNIRVAGGSAYRCETLVAAAELLNQQLAAEGIKDTVTVEWIEADSMNDSIVIWAQENNLPEILQIPAEGAFISWAFEVSLYSLSRGSLYPFVAVP